MRLYYAAPLSCAARASRIARAVGLFTGAAPCSRWHYEVPEGAVDPVDPEAMRAILERNLADLASADAVVVLADKGNPGETFAEGARAADSRKPVLWFGRRIASAYLPSVTRATAGSEVELVERAAEWVYRLQTKRHVGRGAATMEVNA